MTNEEFDEILEKTNAVVCNREWYERAVEALVMVEEFKKAQIITGGRLNGRTYAYKCGLEDGKRKALEQQSSDCVSKEQLKRELHAQMAVDAITKETAEDMLNHLPPVTATHGTCKDCKHYYIDEDGHGYHCEKFDYTRFPVYADFYCADYEKRGNKNESIS